MKKFNYAHLKPIKRQKLSGVTLDVAPERGKFQMAACRAAVREGNVGP